MLCLITGGTSGIGSAAVHALARLGADVIFVGRNRERGHRDEERIRKAHPARSIHFYPLDLSSMVQVHQFADMILDRYERIDCLINNAGSRFDRFQQSVDGIELTFAVNHLSHYLLTMRLLPVLMRAEQARILTLSSGAARSARVIQDQWVESNEGYDRKQAYAKAKLANLVFAIELAKRLRGTHVTSNAVDPGVVATRFALNNGLIAWARHVLSHWVRRELTPVASEGSSLAELATRVDLRSVTGKLFRRGAVVSSAETDSDPKLADSLWKLSTELTGVNEGSYLVTSPAGIGVL